MIEETGTVVSLDSGKVWIEIVRQSACNSCAAQKGCGHSVLDKIYEGRRHQVMASTDIMLEVGDEVILGVPENTVFKGSFMLYLVPLLSTLGGMWLAGMLTAVVNFHQDVLSAFGACVGIGVGAWFIRSHSRKNEDNPDYLPAVMRCVSRVNDQPIQIG